MKYKWTDRSVFNYYYDIETGSIVAKLSRISFSDDVWNAEINGDFLGQYISEAHGREAIEKKVKEIDACARRCIFIPSLIAFIVQLG